MDPKTKDPYRVIGVFGYGGDDLARKTGVTPPPEIPGVPGLHKVVSSAYTDHFHIIAKQLSNEGRQVIVWNEQDFFEDFEKTHGATLDSQTVTYGNEWDLYSASMSETSARAKRAVEKLRSAELLAAMVSLKYPAFMKNHTAARDRAFNNLGLFWEHNWTADGPISRPHRAAWEEEVVSGIESYVNSIQGEAIVRLGGMIPHATNSNRFFVLNPLGWPRTDAADLAYTGSTNIHVRDLTTSQDVPHQIVMLSGARHLRILASDVPSAGYKVFEILPGKGDMPTGEAAKLDGDVFENDAVKLVLESDGAIRSFIDKRRGNTVGKVTVSGLNATGVYRSAISVESWADEPITNVVLRNVQVEFAGGGTAAQTQQPVKGPGVDARSLPAWGLFARHVQTLSFEDVRFSLTSDDFRPVVVADRVEQLSFDNFKYPRVSGVTDSVVSTKGGKVVIPQIHESR